jgi:hypothetical protein
MIRPLHNQFFFVFLNETANGVFVAKNKGRIIIPTVRSQDLRGQGDYGRWGKVLAIGKEVKDFKNGSIVLIDKLQWTKGFEYEGFMIWKSDQDKVLAIGEDESVAYDYSVNTDAYA